MDFEEILDQAMTMLQRRGRMSYRTLTRLQSHRWAHSATPLWALLSHKEAHP